MSLKLIVFSALVLTISWLQPIARAQRLSGCAALLCEPNSQCTECELTPCNNYTCDNQFGAAIMCAGECQPTKPTCICDPGYHRPTPDAPCTLLICEETCDKKECGEHETCTTCGINFCNTYSCANPDGALCKPGCVKSNATCICEPGYIREKPDAPCTPLKCPTEETCDKKECGEHETCTTCGINFCNTYSCKNPDGALCKPGCVKSNATCICEPGYIREKPDAPCTPLKCPTDIEETCETKTCGRNEECSECKPNSCNTYSCKNPAGAFCKMACITTSARCACKQGYHRATPDAPCTPLKCPTDSQETCDTKECGEHETCTTCGINFCNTYSCANPVGAFCKPGCVKSNATCICEPGYHREKPDAPCTPLKCPTDLEETCETKTCGRNEDCSECEPNICNTYSCKNPGGLFCKMACIKTSPRCACKQGYIREKPDAPCTPLRCPPVQEKCGASQCGENEVCRPCGPDGCNTYSCKNPDGSNIGCADVCMGEPTCMCKPNYHREKPDAPCTPLKC